MTGTVQRIHNGLARSAQTAGAAGLTAGRSVPVIRHEPAIRPERLCADRGTQERSRHVDQRPTEHV